MSAWVALGAIVLASACVADSGTPPSASISRGSPPPSASSARSPSRPAREMDGYGWAVLPPPPVLRSGDSMLWVKDSLLDWGGSPSGGSNCSGKGNQYTPGRGWSAMTEAPRGLCGARAVWTGKEAIFWRGGRDKGAGGVAFDPSSGVWSTLPRPPAGVVGSAVVWTGKEMIAWGGGKRGTPSTARGAAFDPSAGKWRRIADAPLGLNLVSGVWTGKEVIFFGSLLDNGNHAATRSSVGAAYSPTKDSWRALPRSQLSPQATSVGWVNDEMVAWDYETHSQVFSPKTWRWGPPAKMPMQPSECYPDSFVVGSQLFAWYCGEAALFDGHHWTGVEGGAMDVKVAAYGHHISMFRFGQFASSPDALYMQATGITVSAKGTACYGCPGAPVSFWVYRPGPSGAHCLSTNGRDMYAVLASPVSGKADSNFSVFGNVPTRVKSGKYTGPSGRIEFWWNLDPQDWVGATGGTDGGPPSPSPSTDRGKAVLLGSVDVNGRCTYGTTFKVPAEATPGRYPVVGIERGGGGAAAFQPVWYTVTLPPSP